MKPRTMMERIRQRLCLHRNAYIRAATGLERAGGQHSGNGIVGVTLICPNCGWQVSTDVVMAVPKAALDALYLPCHCTHEAGDSPCPLHGMDENPVAPQPGGDARGLPDGTLVTCEICPTPHEKGEDGRPCKYPKVAPAAPAPTQTACPECKGVGLAPDSDPCPACSPASPEGAEP